MENYSTSARKSYTMNLLKAETDLLVHLWVPKVPRIINVVLPKIMSSILFEKFKCRTMEKFRSKQLFSWPQYCIWWMNTFVLIELQFYFYGNQAVVNCRVSHGWCDTNSYALINKSNGYLKRWHKRWCVSLRQAFVEHSWRPFYCFLSFFKMIFQTHFGLIS